MGQCGNVCSGPSTQKLGKVKLGPFPIPHPNPPKIVGLYSQASTVDKNVASCGQLLLPIDEDRSSTNIASTGQQPTVSLHTGHDGASVNNEGSSMPRHTVAY